MKLFIWNKVYLDWDYGIAFALANNEEEARILVKINSLEKRGWIDEGLDEPPDAIHDTAIGYTMMGSS